MNHRINESAGPVFEGGAGVFDKSARQACGQLIAGDRAAARAREALSALERETGILSFTFWLPQIDGDLFKANVLFDLFLEDGFFFSIP